MSHRDKKLRHSNKAERRPAAVARSAASRRPNVVFIIADDLTAHAVRSLGNAEVRTEHLDKLAAAGCSFRHCFHQGSWTPAVCIASRTMLFTGLSAFRAQQQAETALLWPAAMAAAGYHTHSIGKWHLSRRNLRRGFKTLGLTSCGGMFDSTDPNGAAYHRPAPGNDWKPWDTSQKGHWLRLKDWKADAKDRVIHSAELWTDEAVEFINRRAGCDEPFFLHVGFHLPHDPRQSPREIVASYPPEKIALPPNYMPCHPFDQGDYDIRDELLAPFPRTPEAVRLHRAEYYAAVTMLDRQIGRLLAALETTGEAQRTLVVVTSDHGLAVGEHGLMGKQNLYDCSVRVPLMMRGPGVPRGCAVEAQVYQHSLYATVCELTGVTSGPTLEFRSLLPLMRSEAAAGEDAVFGFYRHFQRSLRTREHKLIVYPQSGVVQLFDLQADPWETTNLAYAPKQAGLRRKLLGQLVRQQRRLGDVLSLAACK
ncbi:MAG: sulfatase-like hydrolase/transferase [Phycisphaerales bacterium]|nr:sulfatase-like hydrolase/transferase [Phycisphaerales bacterium]